VVLHNIIHQKAKKYEKEIGKHVKLRYNM